MITEEEFKGWLEDPVTKALRKKLRDDVVNYQAMLVTVEPEELRMIQAHCQAAIKMTEIEWGDIN